MVRAVLLIALSLCLAPSTPAAAPAAFQEPASPQESVVYLCPMHPEVQSSTAGKCPKCEMNLVAQREAKKEAEDEEQAEAYACPMHPEVRTNAPGKCPKCAMALVPTNPDVVDYFELKLDSTPARPKPNEKARLRFVVVNPKTGQQAKQFALLHDELFHLFIISQDMTEFQHIHPKFEPDGSFTIETVLPQAGRYKVYSDFYPVEGTPQVLQKSIVTAGHSSDLFAGEAKLVPDTSFTKTADGMRVDLKIDPAEIIAGRPVTLKYKLTDAKTGEPVTDLVPYLAAWGHTLILSEDQSDYVHSHPEETVPEAAERSRLRGGPEVTFEALFPRPGVYKIWTQFLRGEKLTTVSFTVRAERLR
jgi:hypothetical protein